MLGSKHSPISQGLEIDLDACLISVSAKACVFSALPAPVPGGNHFHRGSSHVVPSAPESITAPKTSLRQQVPGSPVPTAVFLSCLWALLSPGPLLIICPPPPASGAALPLALKCPQTDPEWKADHPQPGCPCCWAAEMLMNSYFSFLHLSPTPSLHPTSQDSGAGPRPT